MASETHVIVGRNPVLEALRAGRPVERLLVAKGASGAAIDEIVALARRSGLTVQFDDRRRLDRLAEGHVHQGVVAVAAPVPYVSVDEILALARRRGEEPLLLALDEVQDPHNLGSLLRSADGAGAHGIVVPRRRSAGLDHDRGPHVRRRGGARSRGPSFQLGPDVVGLERQGHVGHGRGHGRPEGILGCGLERSLGDRHRRGGQRPGPPRSADVRLLGSHPHARPHQLPQRGGRGRAAVIRKFTTKASKAGCYERRLISVEP